MSGELLLQEIQKKGLLTQDSVTRVKRDALISGRSEESILYEEHILDDVQVAQVKSEALKVPYRKIDMATYDESLLPLLREEVVRTYQVVPISKKDNLLIAGMVNPDDTKAQEALKFASHQAHLNLGVFLISYGDWQKVMRKYSPYQSEIQDAVQALKIKGDGERRKVVELEGGNVGMEDAPIIRIVADTLREAVQGGASDIHIEPEEKYLRIRLRVDGNLREVAQLPSELSQAVVSRVKVLCNLKIDESRIPQDGRFRSRIADREIDFRVATFPTPLGEKVAIRVLDSTTGLKSFSDLGLVGNNLAIVNEALEKPYGMILITGPTGSGKTTTLYAILQGLNNDDVNIVSLEDPVEYFVAGVNQSQVRPEIGYDFASGLRQILRQDPDVIMVGEIRDNETAGLAVQAALTGHIVLSTLHTNNSAGVIPRLMDMKVEPFLLPAAVNLMMGQRLVGKLCEACRKAEPASEPMQKIIKKNLEGLPENETYKEPYQIYHAPGCDVCKRRGVVGRLAIFEVLRMTPEMEIIINKGASLQAIQAEQRRQGGLTMRQDGVLKALSGTVSFEEVMRETEETV